MKRKIAPKSGAPRKASQTTAMKQLQLLWLFLRIRKWMSAREIRDQLASVGCEVDERTMQRYLKNLSEAFPEIQSDGNSPPGWRMDISKVSNLFSISPEMSLALTLIEKNLWHLLPSSEQRKLEPLFKNARNVLDSPLNIASKGWIERVHSIPRGYPLIPPSIAGEIFDNISEGIRTSKKLACIYKKPDGSVSNRTLAPLGLIERGGFFYLVSRDEGDGVVKKFKLNRFEAVQLTSEGFLYPRDFDMRHELRKGDISPTFSPERINVRLRLERSAGAHLLEAKLGDDQMIHLNDGKFIELSATVDNSDELRWWIMAICDKCEILEPEALRRELNERIKSAQKLYGSERATDA